MEVSVRHHDDIIMTSFLITEFQIIIFCRTGFRLAVLKQLAVG